MEGVLQASIPEDRHHEHFHVGADHQALETEVQWDGALESLILPDISRDTEPEPSQRRLEGALPETSH